MLNDCKNDAEIGTSELVALDVRFWESEARHMLTLADLAKRADATWMRAYDDAVGRRPYWAHRNLPNGGCASR